MTNEMMVWVLMGVTTGISWLLVDLGDSGFWHRMTH
jgi:hypothetical protein